MDFDSILKRFLCDLIKWATAVPDQPGLFSIRVLREEDMLNVTEITFPELRPGNPQKVNVRRFKVTQEASDTSEAKELHNQDYPFDQGPVVVKLTQGTTVTLSLIDIDQAGNASKETTHTGPVEDVTGPDAPGPFGIKVLGEEEEPPVA